MNIINRVFVKTITELSSVIPESVLERRFTILIYHRVLNDFDPLLSDEIYAELFDWQMELLAKYFNPVSVSDALTAADKSELQPRTVCVTFDDGYSDNEEVALPILKKWGIPATFFIATGFLNGKRMWNDSVIETIRGIKNKVVDFSGLGIGIAHVETDKQRRELIGKLLPILKYLPPEERERQVENISSLTNKLPQNLMMRDEQVRSLVSAGMEIGAHTVSHPILSNLSQSEAENEIRGSVERLQDITGIKPEIFAYPNGKPGIDYTSRDCAILKELGLKAAVSTKWGSVGRDSYRYELPRFTPWDRSPIKFSIRLIMSNLGLSPSN